MKQKWFSILMAMMVTALFSSCFEDAKDAENPATLNVTVTVDSNIWGYPMEDPANLTNYWAFSGAADYLWKYPAVGGDGAPPTGEKTQALEAIASDKVGDQKIVIYMYSPLGASADTEPVLYNGESSSYSDDTTSNQRTITISDIEAGDYYIVAFYDYNEGGNIDNLLNRYDRYAIYTQNNAYAGTLNSTPFSDQADAITLGNNENVDIELEIGMDWILGKPKVGSTDGFGRLFLTSGESLPTP